MRRKTGIVIGALVALTLTGTAGAATWHHVGDDGEGRTVGTWHEAPGVARTPVAQQRRVVAPEAAPAAATQRGAKAEKTAGTQGKTDAVRTTLPESADGTGSAERPAAEEGRFRVPRILGEGA